MGNVEAGEGYVMLYAMPNPFLLSGICQKGNAEVQWHRWAVHITRKGHENEMNGVLVHDSAL